MKKFLLSIIAVAAFCMSANAAEYKIMPNGTGVEWTATTDPAGFTTTVNGFTITTAKDSSSTALVAPTDLIKVYKKSSITIDGGTQNITTVVFTCSAASYCNDFTPSTGKATTDATATTITWEGTASKITFASLAGQSRISEIDIYTDGSKPATKVSVANTAETAYTVERAVELINNENSDLTDSVYVKGIISQIDSYNEKYGSITYWISADGTTTGQQFECYSGMNEGKEKFASIEDLFVGDEVVVKGVMKKYTPKTGDPIYEFNNSNYIVSRTGKLWVKTLKATDYPDASFSASAKKDYEVTLEALTDGSYILRGWFGVADYDLQFTVDNATEHILSYTPLNKAVYTGYETFPLTGENTYYSYYFYIGDTNYKDYGGWCPWAYVTKDNGYIYLYGRDSSGNYTYIYFGWPDESTGINAVEAAQPSKETPAYNLAGQQVNANAKGLIIKNGHKFFCK